MCIGKINKFGILFDGDFIKLKKVEMESKKLLTEMKSNNYI